MLSTEEINRLAEEALAEAEGALAEFETPPLPGMEEIDRLTKEALAEAELDRRIDELLDEL